MASGKKALGILFGVKGGGTLDQGSGKLILEDLKKIVNKINNNKKLLPAVQLTLDAEKARKSIAELKKDLGSVHEMIKKMPPVPAASSGKGSNSGGSKDNADASEIQKRTKAINEYLKVVPQLHRLKNEYAGLELLAGGKLGFSGKASDSFKASFQPVIKYYEKIHESFAKVIPDFDIFAFKLTYTDKEIAEHAQTLGITVDQYKELRKIISSAQPKMMSDFAQQDRTQAQRLKDYSAKISDFLERNKGNIAKNPHAQILANELNQMIQTSSGGIGELKEKYKEFLSVYQKFGLYSESWAQRFKKAISDGLKTALAGWVTGILSKAIKSVYNNVVSLDKAIVNLQIASGKSREETRRLLTTYSDLAKRLGSTTEKVAESADTWLRQGYSAKDAGLLIKNSTMLATLGQMEAADASTALTSAMKGYKLSVEESTAVVDKFTAVDMEAAASAGDIATAMAETATSADIAGVSMDRLIGYIATVKEVTQDGAESVGTFYKTLFARMNSVAAGKFVDEETGESLNDVETVLTSLNIAVRDQNGVFLSSADVLDEVAKRWENFDGVAKHAIATAFAGTRQQEKFIVLMENYGTAIEYANVAAESGGTAAEKFQAHLGGIDAKMQSLTSSFQKLSLNVLDSNLITGTLSFLTKVVDGLNAVIDGIGGVNTLLTATIGLVGTLTAHSIAAWFSGLASAITQAGGKLKFLKNLFAQVSTQVPKLTLGVGILAAAVTVAVGLINHHNQSVQKSIDASREAAAAAREAAEAYNENAKSIKELAEEYAVLYKESGGTFDATQTQKIQSLQDQITKLVGEQAKNLDLVNGKLDDELKKLKDIADQELAAMDREARISLASAERAYLDASKKFAILLPYSVYSKNPQNNAFTGHDDADFVTSLTSKHGVQMYSRDPNNASASWGFATQFDSIQGAVSQYAAVTSLRDDLALSGQTDTNLFRVAEKFLADYKQYYEDYMAAQNMFDAIEETRNKNKKLDTSANGHSVLGKDYKTIFEEVREGYDGIAEALKGVTTEGYLTADAMESLWKLEAENKLAGLDLEDILEKDANGYKLKSTALEQYIKTLTDTYAIEGKYATLQDKQNASDNLTKLKNIIALLATTQESVDKANERQRKNYEKQQDALNEQLDAYKELIDVRKELLETFEEEVKYQKELEKKQKSVASLQTRLAVARLDKSAAGQARVRELEKELAEAQEDLDDFTLEHAIEVLTDELDSQYSEYENLIKAKLDEIEALLEKLNETPDDTDDKEWASSVLSYLEAIKTQISQTPVKDGPQQVPFGLQAPADAYTTGIRGPTKGFLGSAIVYKKYHSGGIVGGYPLSDTTEEFAKLLKGEVVATPSQMKTFMEKTLPSAVSSTASGNEFNAPLIEIQCGSVTTESLPKLETVIKEAVKEVKRQLDGGMSRVGYKRPTSKLLAK